MIVYVTAAAIGTVVALSVLSWRRRLRAPVPVYQIVMARHIWRPRKLG